MDRAIEELDKMARRIAERVYREEVSSWDEDRLVSFIDKVTGGLGYTKEAPLDSIQMIMAGTVIAWPEAVKDGYKILEIGTGIGRTCYTATYGKEARLLVTIEASAEILAIALYRNPVKEFSECLWRDNVKIILADARKAVQRIPKRYFDHLIHDGGPNPLRNPALYTPWFLDVLRRTLRRGATASIFAGRARQAKQLVYKALQKAQYKIIGTASLPGSPAIVYRALNPY